MQGYVKMRLALNSATSQIIGVLLKLLKKSKNTAKIIVRMHVENQNQEEIDIRMFQKMEVGEINNVIDSIIISLNNSNYMNYFEVFIK